jgi:L-asparagine transporter-like permease
MIGAGLFVLPGIAAAKAGPAVILSYLLAGLIIIPAALSKARLLVRCFRFIIDPFIW